MAHLVAPHSKYHASWLDAAREFDGAHRDGSGAEDWTLAELSDPAAFATFVASLHAGALPETPRKPGYVPCTYLWMVDGATVLGSLAIRHELNEHLRNEVGHIGYSVRPSARRQGHAAQALKDALPLARRLGIEDVLVTCAEGNAGSRAVIEGAGGSYEDSRNGNRRYWLSSQIPPSGTT